MTPWLLAAVLAALVVARLAVDLALWAKRIRPRLDALDTAVAALHADVEAWTADQNERLDALLANSADQGGRHGVTGQTGYIPPVTRPDGATD